jgi:hypothetical protein
MTFCLERVLNRVSYEREENMKLPQDNTSSSVLTTLAQVIGWQSSLLQVHARLASYFARPEPYERVLHKVQSVLSHVERKNGWQLAEQAREATSYGMQRLLSQAVWDEDGVRDEVRALALAFLVSICVQQHPAALPVADGGTQAMAAGTPPDLQPLSVLEGRHLLAQLLFPPPSSVKLVLQWSAWRRWHQRLASFFHTKRRVKAG